MLISLIFAIAGLGLLALGAEGLVRGSSSVALRFGIAPLVVGLTIVAFGTGAPEFAISIGSALEGRSGLALGNVVGSNISNVALILGAAALVNPLKARSEVVRRETPLMAVITAFLLVLLYDGELSRLDGGILTVGAVGYTVLTYGLAVWARNKSVESEFRDAYEQPRSSIWRDLVFIAVGLGLLVGGAQLLLRGAVDIATVIGISEPVIGLTIVAIGTSLPELATSVIASKKGESDVALGNAIGSNTLNILGVLGVTAMIQPISTAGVRALDFGAMLGAAILLSVLLGRNYELDRVEGGALIIGYGIYMYSLVP